MHCDSSKSGEQFDHSYNGSNRLLTIGGIIAALGGHFLIEIEVGV
jgi:hypothetical protein